MLPERVVAFGGGHGLYASLSALRHLSRNLTAVVTVADNGGSSGRLRQEFGILPPGDLRMAMAALCANTDEGHLWRDVLQHRFESDGPLDNHAVGNLLLAALWRQLDDPVEGLNTLGQLIGMRGHVLPMSSVPLEIVATIQGKEVRGQVQVATTSGRVTNVHLDPPDAPVAPQVLDAVANADAIVLGPGSWFTSVLPHLMIPELRDAISSSRAQRVLTLNLTTQRGETDGMSLADHLRIFSRYAPGLTFGTVIADPVVVEDIDDVADAAEELGARLMLRQVRSTQNPAVHDPLRLAAAFRDALDVTLKDS